MKYKHLHALTEEGNKIFQEVFTEKKEFDTSMLNDPEFSKPLINTSAFEVTAFKDSFVAAKSIHNSLGNFALYRDNHDLWRWLTLALYHHVLKPSEIEAKDYGKSNRYDPAPFTDWKVATRHLVRTPVYLFDTLGDDSEYLISSPLYVGGQMKESVTQTALFVTPGISSVFKELFWDSEKSKIKNDAHDKKPGDERDLVRVLKQLMVTYGIESMNPLEIIELLPEVFHERWT